MKRCLLLALLLSPAPGFCMPLTFDLKGGQAMPFGGDWGDPDVGYKPATAVAFAGWKKVDDRLAWGLEAGLESGHRSRANGALKIDIFHLAPSLRATFPSGVRTWTLLAGAGVFHWKHSAYAAGSSLFDAGSATNFGVSLGAGVKRRVFGLPLGLEAVWRHLFSMKSDGVGDVGPADNLCLYLSVHFGDPKPVLPPPPLEPYNPDS
ncbi:MAG: hypothetical protein FD189_140 [Elusimicrobia bacterium]|nr:MAG: hypothetical protein FD154_292 [Elusimicrobiota bacterium]KAF0158148.1 MAG: hypothetical protein FD189_140 [Elusimicrobiota bacterium]